MDEILALMRKYSEKHTQQLTLQIHDDGSGCAVIFDSEDYVFMFDDINDLKNKLNK